MAKVKIIKAGLASSIQDKGRSGFYHLGIPPSGSMDQTSAMIANLLVGNDESAAVIECALIGAEISTDHSTLVAVSGADMQPQIDGESVPLNTALLLKKGQSLKLNFAKKGARSYIAIAGGIDVPIVLGSRSTYTLGGLGGFNGRLLQDGDILDIIDTTPNLAYLDNQLSSNLAVDFNAEKSLRLMLGIYDHRVEKKSLDDFFNEQWTVASEADRIGYRFKGGTQLSFKQRKKTPFGAGSDPSNIVDACYPIGSVQVPAGKEPIILHRDAVSGGGYMMIGAIISADMDKIGQLPPNSKINFESINMNEALKARKNHQNYLNIIRQQLNSCNN